MHYLQDFTCIEIFLQGQNKEEHVIKPQVRVPYWESLFLKVGGINTHLHQEDADADDDNSIKKKSERKRSRGGRRKEFDVRDH